MKLRYVWLFSLIITLSFCGCNNKSFGMMDGTETIHINRFDSALFQWINTDDFTILEEIKKEYPLMLDVLGKSLLQAENDDMPAFFDYLINYYSEPTLKALYKDALSFYSSGSPEITLLENELSYCFAQIKKHFPLMQIPAVYMHISGLQQNIIIADSLLSCSVDKYLGADYPLYETYFYDYQRKSMIPERIAKDCLAAWIKTEYPDKGKDNILLDRMIYEGKIIYILTQIGKSYTFQNITSLTDDEYKWCMEYESSIWTTMIERKHLYTPDITATSKYFLPSPSLFISEDAPGNLGSFIGYRIVELYIKKTKSTLEELMNNHDAQDILQKSKYKP